MNEIIKPSLTMLILDFIWLTMFMSKRYKVMIKDIQGEELKVNMVYAAFAYLLMIIGQQVYIKPLIKSKKDVLIYGGLFGLIVFGVYDLTAGAVIKKWDLNLAIIDILWGVFLFTVSSLPLLKNNKD
jgi:uncharacterized membrane protein